MKKEITHREDIVMLVNSFYEKVKVDTVIGHIFSDVANVNWDHHLPVMVDFWERVLLDGRSYSGNPMIKHIALNKQYRLSEEHFEVWLRLFNQTVDKLFTGSKADEAKARAVQIAQLMQHKIKISESS